MAEVVKFTTMDGEDCEYDKNVASKSVMVQGIIDDNGADDAIPLPGINKPTLEKIMDYCKDLVEKEDPQIHQPLRSNNMKENLREGDAWAADFIDKVDKTMLFNLADGSKLMTINSLHELACAKIASNIKGKTPEQIRDFFEIEADLDAEEVEIIKAENKWAEEAI